MDKQPITLTPEQMEMANGLTHLNRMTVIHVVGGMSNRKAYRAAGGKASSDKSIDATVSRMLSNAKSRAFYDSLIASAATSSIMNREEALSILTTHARTDDEDIAYLRNAQSAIKQLSDMEGWNAAQRVEHTGKDGEAIKTEEVGGNALARRVAFLLAKGAKE